jgi:hypothetical protein
LIGVTVAITLVPADAAVVTFTERTTFEAAAGDFAVQDFQSLAGTDLCNPFTPDGNRCGPGPVELIAGDLTITGRAQPYIAPGANLVDPELRFAVSGGGALVTGAMPGFASNFFFTLEISGDAPLTAFGTDTRFWAKDIVVTLLDGTATPIGDPQTFPTPGTEFGFFGIIADTPFDTVRIRSGNDDFVNYDNMAYQAVPEPTVVPLLAAALAIISMHRRCRGSSTDLFSRSTAGVDDVATQ